MLMSNYRYRIVLPDCNREATTVNAVAEIAEDISEILPYLNAVIKGSTFRPQANILRFVKDGHAITIHPREIAVTRCRDEDEAKAVLEEIKRFINDTYQRRHEIQPSYKQGDEVKFIDVFKLLPGTNCRQCGQPTCLVFATRLAKGEAKLSDCVPLGSNDYSQKRARLTDMLEAAGCR